MAPLAQISYATHAATPTLNVLTTLQSHIARQGYTRTDSIASLTLFVIALLILTGLAIAGLHSYCSSPSSSIPQSSSSSLSEPSSPIKNYKPEPSFRKVISPVFPALNRMPDTSSPTPATLALTAVLLGPAGLGMTGLEAVMIEQAGRKVRSEDERRKVDDEDVEMKRDKVDVEKMVDLIFELMDAWCRRHSKSDFSTSSFGLDPCKYLVPQSSHVTESFNQEKFSRQSHLHVLTRGLTHPSWTGVSPTMKFRLYKSLSMAVVGWIVLEVDLLQSPAKHDSNDIDETQHSPISNSSHVQLTLSSAQR
ncbi:hypothetical protein JAAARDRAFT_43882 [Jaapia argillacea MUCL 33604]|uniref:Uncharacterized protein n=1 Tax=Jaapia argillacea MUCL 33604 TaxID=933084 RepID=A0A067QDT6_9AGAM|nr:hypothetical protein JAAARDRAFT_43882 [Jaapia argillacea MUCL 33604]